MTCDCKNRIETKLTERFKGEFPEAKNHGAELKGYGFSIVGNEMKLLGYLPVEKVADYPLKKGGTKRRYTKQSLFFSYCPFCGVKEGAI